MTPKEALNTLDETVIRNLELKIVLSEAIKKQIPKKPIEKKWHWAICPICGGSVYLENVQEYVINKKHSHCEHCGQAIDWSDTEC